mgnify:CR=1 FL=1
MQNTERDLKLYYSISEVAQMFDVNESLLRFWEKEFPQLRPKKGGRGIRQYRKEDIETVKLIYHLVKERGMTLPGARQRMKDNKEATLRNFEIVERLRSIREELTGMKEALDAFTYEDVEALKENLMKSTHKELPFYSRHLLDVLYQLQVVADAAYIVYVMYVELYLTFKYTVSGFNGQFTDVHVQLAGDDLRHFIQQSHAVNTFQIDSYKE